MWKLLIREILSQKTRFLTAVGAITIGVVFLTLLFAGRNLAVDALRQAQTATLNGDLYAIESGGSKSEKTGGDTEETGGKTREASETSETRRTHGSGGESEGETHETSETLSPALIDARLADVIESVEGVSHAVPLYETRAVLLDSKRRPVNPGMAPTVVYGAFPYPPGPTLAAGRLPHGSTEAMLESATAKRLGCKLGSAIFLVWGGQTHRLRIVGIADFEEPVGFQSVVFVNSTQARTWFSPRWRVKTIGIKVGVAQDVHTVQERIQSAVGKKALIVTRAVLCAQELSVAQPTVGILNLATAGFTIMSLAVGGFLVANSVGFLVVSRYRELGLLRCVGYSPRFLRCLMLAQVLAAGLGGFLGGIVAGTAALAAVRLVLANWGWDFSVPFADLGAVLAAGGLGLFTAVVAGIFPALRAGSIRPVPVPGSPVFASRPGFGWQTKTGLCLLLVSLAGHVCAWRLSGGVWDWIVVVVLAVSGIGFLAATVLLLPHLVAPFLWCLLWVVKGLRLLPASLAVQDLRRNPGRVSLGAAALAVGVAVGSLGGVLADSTRVSLELGVKQQVHADLVVVSREPQTGEKKIVEKIANIPGVEKAQVGAVYAPVSTGGRDSAGQSRVSAAGLAVPGEDSLVRLRTRQGRAEALPEGEVMVSSRLAHDRGWKLGETIRLAGSAGTYSTRVGGVADAGFLGAGVFLDRAVLSRMVASEQLRWKYVFVSVSRPSDGSALKPVARVKHRLERALRQYAVLSVFDRAQFASAEGRLVDPLVVALVAWSGFLVFVALLGVVNVLVFSLQRRQAGFVLLRMLGAEARELGAVVRWEAGFLALAGAFFGAVAGILLAVGWWLVWGGEPLIVLAVPWLSLGGLVVAAVLVAALLAWIPSRLAARVPI